MKMTADISRDGAIRLKKHESAERGGKNVHRKVLLRMAESVIEFTKNEPVVGRNNYHRV